MTAAFHGNNPDAWKKFLDTLDDRLQFGLLSYLKNATAYHFEEKILYIEFVNQSDIDYLSRDAVKQQLQVLAQSILGVEEVQIRKPS